MEGCGCRHKSEKGLQLVRLNVLDNGGDTLEFNEGWQTFVSNTLLLGEVFPSPPIAHVPFRLLAFRCLNGSL